MSDRERARDFLREHLPGKVMKRLANTPPEILDGSFTDETLAGSQSDLLLKVRLDSGSDAFVYILAEHKSAPDPGLPLQLASYMVRIWRRHAGSVSDKLRSLPPIIPVVVYHGDAKWSVPEGLPEMIDAESGLSWLPGEGYILLNLRSMEIEKLSRNPALLAGFAALRREDAVMVTRFTAELPSDSEIVRQILEYLLRVYHNVSMDRLRESLRRDGHEDLETLVGTIAESLLRQGEERGLAEGEARGLARGEERGMAKGKAETLARLLERRFGTLPGNIRNRVATAEPAQVDTWLDALFDAPELGAVFADGRKR